MKYKLKVTPKPNDDPSLINLPDVEINGKPAGLLDAIICLFEMVEELECRLGESDG